MSIRLANVGDIEAWVELRLRLWPDHARQEHRDEAVELLARSWNECAVFLDDDGADGLRGFAEVSLRRDYVNGCRTSPVAFLEGIYVRPTDRGRGIGAQMLGSVRFWAQAQGCTELASDAALDNTGSHSFHRAVGFEETSRVVYFRRTI